MNENDAPVRDLVADELDRLCDTPVLRRSPSHTRLLRYLVERALERDMRALTETAIGIAVFQRDPASYDPQLDPIVRVTVSRLRHRLLDVYATPQPPGRVRILVPRGQYIPEFVVDGAPGRSALRVAILAMRNASGSARHDAFCRAFERQLAGAMSAPGQPRVVAHSRVRHTGAERETVALGRRLGVDALIEPVLTQDGRGELRISVRLVDTADGHVRWTETGAVDVARPAPQRDRIVARTLARLRPSAANAGAD